MCREREGHSLRRGISYGRQRLAAACRRVPVPAFYVLLAAVALGFCWYFVLRYGVFGSRVDWIDQHSVFPAYFRKRFYETKDLLPDYAWNLGAGQNIYTISYYGLFSPVILVSYLLPFIPMDYYIMGSSIASYIAAVLLMFYWLGNHRYRRSFRLLLTVLFSLCSPLIYHFYNQIMFVNYMPFLCLALIGTDRYLSDRRRGCLLCGVWGMILTSFYFSIGGILALCLYALSEYLLNVSEGTHSSEAGEEGEGKRSLAEKGKDLFAIAVRYVGQIMLAVLLSGVLLVPTAAVIMGGQRSQAENIQESFDLISFEPLRILYSPYGAGASVLVIAAVIGGIICAKRWAERVLPVSLFLVFSVSAVGALLNGGLYVRDKAFIPFLPLLILQCARFLEGQMRQRWSFRTVLPWLITGLLLWEAKLNPDFQEYRYPVTVLVMVDFIGCMVCFCLAKWKKVPELVVAFSALCLFVFQMELHPEMNRMLSREEYAAVYDQEAEHKAEEIGREDTGFYRMEIYQKGGNNLNHINRLVNLRQNITSFYSSCYSEAYMTFRKDVFHINEPQRNLMMQAMTDNPCFRQFMGVKYCIEREGQAEPVLKENEGAAPIWYVTDQVMSDADYRKAVFPECQTLLLQRSVVSGDSMDTARQNASSEESSSLPKMSRQSMPIPELDTEHGSIKAGADGTYRICAKRDITVSVSVSGQNRNQDLLAVSFDIVNQHPDRDVKISVNQQANKLTSEASSYANHNDTFHYMVSHLAGQRVEITFGAGEYELRNYCVYTGCMAALQNRSLYQNPVQTDPDQPQGDSLSGQVSCDTDGYLITSIPYDEHFELQVDGKQIEPERVNTAFLGAKLEAGEHRIQITYHAPGKRAGIGVSLLGLGLWLLSGLWVRRKGAA